MQQAGSSSANTTRESRFYATYANMKKVQVCCPYNLCGVPMLINQLLVTNRHRSLASCSGYSDPAWRNATSEQVLDELDIVTERVHRYGTDWDRYSIPMRRVYSIGGAIPFETEVQHAHERELERQRRVQQQQAVRRQEEQARWQEEQAYRQERQRQREESERQEAWRRQQLALQGYHHHGSQPPAPPQVSQQQYSPQTSRPRQYYQQQPTQRAQPTSQTYPHQSSAALAPTPSRSSSSSSQFVDPWDTLRTIRPVQYRPAPVSSSSQPSYRQEQRSGRSESPRGDDGRSRSRSRSQEARLRRQGYQY